ncbi:unnamed protein product [Peniophora sp. CBMAI 1063]|nr:unnamed protein product [Peniophora sp. CBMAI 1063]
MIYDVTPDGGVARFNKWLEDELAGAAAKTPAEESMTEDTRNSFSVLADMERALLEAKAAHNAKAPILRLPVEILADIVFYTRDAWLSMTSRAVALDNPKLWTSLSDDATPSLAYLLKVALPRSRYMKISLSIRVDDKDKDTMAHLLRSLRSLEIHGKIPSEDPSAGLNAQLNPQHYYSSFRESIRVLRLNVSNDQNERVLLHLDPLPNVRELSLTGSAINWKGAIYHKLTRLTLALITPPPSAPQLRGLLKRAQRLRYLKLDRTPVTPEAGNPFLLPDNLQTIDIIAPALDFAQSLSPSRRLPIAFPLRMMKPTKPGSKRSPMARSRYAPCCNQHSVHLQHRRSRR